MSPVYYLLVSFSLFFICVFCGKKIFYLTDKLNAETQRPQRIVFILLKHLPQKTQNETHRKHTDSSQPRRGEMFVEMMGEMKEKLHRSGMFVVGGADVIFVAHGANREFGVSHAPRTVEDGAITKPNAAVVDGSVN